jgi:ATP-dependent Clp protease protease subunit
VKRVEVRPFSALRLNTLTLEISNAREMSKENDTDQKDFDDVSLESLGTHLFFGPVDTTTAKAACEFILKSNIFDSTSDPLTLVLYTPGGETSAGFAVVDIMETSRRRIATVGSGQVSSMGVLLLSAGAHGLRTLTRNSEIMAHQFSGYFEGKHHELIATAESFKQLELRMFQHFRRHSTMSDKQIRDVLMAPSDRYLTPAECKKYGLVDRVVEYVPVPSLRKSSATK